MQANYAAADWDAEWWEDGLTVVEYEDSGSVKLGVYTKYSVLESDPHIRPLCASCEDDGVSELLCDEDVPVAPLTSVRTILDPDYGTSAGLKSPCVRLLLPAAMKSFSCLYLTKRFRNPPAQCS